MYQGWLSQGEHRVSNSHANHLSDDLTGPLSPLAQALVCSTAAFCQTASAQHLLLTSGTVSLTPLSSHVSHFVAFCPFSSIFTDATRLVVLLGLAGAETTVSGARQPQPLLTQEPSRPTPVPAPAGAEPGRIAPAHWERWPGAGRGGVVAMAGPAAA